MPLNYGSIAGRGFTYQYAYACRRIVEHFQDGTFVSVTLEGHEDIDLEYRENKNIITEFIQVKTREEGRRNWTVREFTLSALVKFLARKTYEKEFSIFHFITDGMPDAGLNQLRVEIIPALNENLSGNNRWQEIVEEMYGIAQTHLQKKKITINKSDFLKVLRRTKITTEYPELPVICDHVLTALAQFEIRKEKVSDAFTNLSREISRVSGLKKQEDHRLSISDVATLLGIPSASRGTLENIHRFKDPAQGWYVHRHEEIDFNKYLKSIATGWTENRLVTGDSGIGKSSFLNNAFNEAEKRGIKVVKMKVYESSYDNFLLQLGDEIIKTLKTKPDTLEKNPRNRLVSTLTDYREKSNYSVLLMIDQFERLFEESNVRIDESRMKQVWRQFTSLCKEINGLSHISFTITSRQHFFWIMFPSFNSLQEASFTYLMLGKFDHSEAEALLDNLLVHSSKEMTSEAKKLLLEKAENEPQIISLSFVNLFSERALKHAVDVAELQDTQPWNNIFKQDVESICKNQLQKLVVFAMANIGRELCDINEIMERVAVSGTFSSEEIRHTLFQIQNTHRLIKQPVDSKFSFYHRKLVEFVSNNYKSEFPAEWVDEGVVWDVQKMIKDEVRISEKMETLISSEKMQIINNYREQLKLAPEELLLIAKSSLLDDLNPEYWVQQSLKVNSATIACITFLLGHTNEEVRIRVVGMLEKYGDEQCLAVIEGSIKLKLINATVDQVEKQLSGINKLIDFILSLFEKRGFLPESNERKIFWIRIAQLRSKNFFYWLQCETKHLQQALRFIIKDLEKGEPQQINELCLSNTVLTLVKIQDEPAKNIFFNFLEQFLEKYLKVKSNYPNSLLPVFENKANYIPKVMINGMQLWIERLHILSSKEAVIRIGLHIDFLCEYAEKDLLPYTESFASEIDKIRLHLLNDFTKRTNKIYLLNKMTLFFNSVKKTELKNATYQQLLTELLETRERDNLIKAIEIATRQGYYEIITRIIGLLETEKILKEEKDLKIVIKIAEVFEDYDAPVDKQLFGIPIWNLTEKILNMQTSVRFPASIHAPFANFFKPCVFNYAFTNAEILTNLFNRIIASKGNALLKYDLLGLILVRMAELGFDLPERKVSIVFNWLKINIQSISDSLILDNEELKGDIFFNFYQLSSLCNKKSRKILDRSCAAYLHALQYYYVRTEQEYFSRRPICAAKAIIIKYVYQKEDWRPILNDLNTWELKFTGNIIAHYGYRKNFHLLAENLFERKEEHDDEVKESAAEDWIDVAWERREYKFFTLCFNNLEEEKKYVYCINHLPQLFSEPLDPDQTYFLTNISKEWHLEFIATLADGFLENKDFLKFILLGRSFFERNDKFGSKSNYATAWLEPSFKVKDLAFFSLCLEHIHDQYKATSDFLFKNEDILNDPAFMNEIARVALERIYLFRILANLFYKKEDLLMFEHFAILFFKSEKNGEHKMVAANNWVFLTDKIKNKKLKNLILECQNIH